MNTEKNTIPPSDRLRVFVSYSHYDKDKFQILKDTLEKLELCVLSDHNIGPGTPFTDAIKGLITHAHLFIPLITREAQDAPWVHQEMGFAIACNIPILPIVLKGVLPKEMIAQLQAIEVDEELSDIDLYLQRPPIRDLVLPRPGPPTEIVQIAEWPEQRAQWMAEWANRVKNVNQGKPAILRQRGAFSSFCIPDEDLTAKIWTEREGDHHRSEFSRKLSRQERQALEWHAKMEGCRLIVDPRLKAKAHTVEQRLARLRTLLKFLRSADDSKVEIVLSPQASKGSLTIVGNWFVAESMVPRPDGYFQTIFNWHAPTVSRWVQRFEEQFDYLYKEQQQEQNKPRPISSRQFAINEIEKIIREYETELGPDQELKT